MSQANSGWWGAASSNMVGISPFQSSTITMQGLKIFRNTDGIMDVEVNGDWTEVALNFWKVVKTIAPTL